MTELHAQPATPDGPEGWRVLVIRRSTGRVAATVRSTSRETAEKEAAAMVRKGT